MERLVGKGETATELGEQAGDGVGQPGLLRVFDVCAKVLNRKLAQPELRCPERGGRAPAVRDMMAEEAGHEERGGNVVDRPERGEHAGGAQLQERSWAERSVSRVSGSSPASLRPDWPGLNQLKVPWQEKSQWL